MMQSMEKKKKSKFSLDIKYDVSFSSFVRPGNKFEAKNVLSLSLSYFLSLSLSHTHTHTHTHPRTHSLLLSFFTPKPNADGWMTYLQKNFEQKVWISFSLVGDKTFQSNEQTDHSLKRETLSLYFCQFLTFSQKSPEWNLKHKLRVEVAISDWAVSMKASWRRNCRLLEF